MLRFLPCGSGVDADYKLDIVAEDTCGLDTVDGFWNGNGRRARCGLPDEEGEFHCLHRETSAWSGVVQEDGGVWLRYGRANQGVSGDGGLDDLDLYCRTVRSSCPRRHL